MSAGLPDNPEIRVFASLGKATVGIPSDRDCVVIAQGNKENIVSLIVFTVIRIHKAQDTPVR